MADLTDIQRAVLRMLAKSTRGYALSTVMAGGRREPLRISHEEHQ
jgi:hypothetical protein